MSQVKKYDPFGYDGLSALMTECEHGDYVRHEDYAALEAELAKLEAGMPRLMQANYDLRQARAALSAPSHGEQVRMVLPELVRDALARRCLWLAFCWNDHNFGPAHEEARKEALKHGIDSFESANEWLAAAPSEGSQKEQGE